MWLLSEQTIRLACRCCNTDQMDFLETLRPARKAGWLEIVFAPVLKIPTPYRWWTHIGTCPRCQQLEKEITAAR